MSRITPDVWMRLASEQVQGSALWARFAAPEITERLIAALDANVKRHLLIRLESNETEIEDSQSRGVAISTRSLEIPGHELGRYLDIACQESTGHEAFDLIGGELAERLAAGAETAPEVVTRVIAKWRRFWGQVPKQMLSREQQCGLFAELWFLSLWLIPRFGAYDAVVYWRGPFGARHDFEWAGRSVEVKATTSTRGRIHHVNSLDQLAPPDQGDLLFFSLQLREEAGATNNLVSLVSACRVQLENDLRALGLFENALAQIGYSPAHELEYAKLKFRIVEQGLFSVRDDFPRLTSLQFPQGLTPGIEHVEYEINLAGFVHLRIARLPNENSLL